MATAAILPRKNLTEELNDLNMSAAGLAPGSAFLQTTSP